MKKNLLLVALLCLSLGTWAQSAHLIRGWDFYYQPDTVYMLAGDSVKFQTQGIHDMVQTDSAAWAINQALTNGGFVTNIAEDTTFVIDTVGTYYYVCSPHGFAGMKGVLIVDSLLSTGQAPIESEQALGLYPNPVQEYVTIEVHSDKAALLRVRDMLGRVTYTEQMKGRPSTVIGSGHFVSGTYVVQLLDAEQKVLRSSLLIIP